MKLAAICDHDTATCLHFAGIHEVFVPTETPQMIFEKTTQRNDIGVIFITEAIADRLGKELKEFRLTHNIPIIIEIPDKKGRLEDHVDFISHLIKRAVGIDISKKEK